MDRRRRGGRADVDAVGGLAHPRHGGGALRQLRQAQAPPGFGRGVVACEAPQALDEPGDPVHPVLGLGQHLLGLRVAAERVDVLGQQAQVGADVGQGIVHLVGDPRGEEAHRLEATRQLEPARRLLGLGAVGEHGPGADLGARPAQREAAHVERALRLGGRQLEHRLQRLALHPGDAQQAARGSVRTHHVAVQVRHQHPCLELLEHVAPVERDEGDQAGIDQAEAKPEPAPRQQDGGRVVASEEPAQVGRVGREGDETHRREHQRSATTRVAQPQRRAGVDRQAGADQRVVPGDLDREQRLPNRGRDAVVAPPARLAPVEARVADQGHDQQWRQQPGTVEPGAGVGRLQRQPEPDPADEARAEEEHPAAEGVLGRGPGQLAQQLARGPGSAARAQQAHREPARSAGGGAQQGVEGDPGADGDRDQQPEGTPHVLCLRPAGRRN